MFSIWLHKKTWRVKETCCQLLEVIVHCWRSKWQVLSRMYPGKMTRKLLANISYKYKNEWGRSCISYNLWRLEKLRFKSQNPFFFPYFSEMGGDISNMPGLSQASVCAVFFQHDLGHPLSNNIIDIIRILRLRAKTWSVWIICFNL